MTKNHSEDRSATEASPRTEIHRVVGVQTSSRGEIVEVVSKWFLYEELASEMAERIGAEEWVVEYRSIPQENTTND